MYVYRVGLTVEIGSRFRFVDRDGIVSSHRSQVGGQKRGTLRVYCSLLVASQNLVFDLGHETCDLRRSLR